ncbi:hypothetical protein [Desulfovibrio falkowii]|uniref:Uncharacterized protein n=1 Tax=Desulfovibrio falkowii TaxID=3136602 RepID=A0ABQ0EAD0_9BACT
MSETTNTPEDMAVLLTQKGRQDVRAMFERYCNSPMLLTLKQVFFHYLNALEESEAEAATLREQVCALRELSDATGDLLDACIDEDSAIAAHDDDQTGRTLETETRLKNVRARLFAAYDKGTKARAKCEALGLKVTPSQQGPHDA